MNIDELRAMLEKVEGWLGSEEAYALYELARTVPHRRVIVEIGSYRGRSTIALALGAKEAGTIVYAIDSHHVHMAGGYAFGPKDNAAFMRNLLDANVVEWVRVINLFSEEVDWRSVAELIDLLFIDGGHEYECVKGDWEQYSRYVQPTGIIAVHDSTGAWDGPTRVVQEAISEDWELKETVGNTSIMRRKT